MQTGSVPCDQKFSCKWSLSFFKAAPPNLGSLLYIISFLLSHSRSWNYPEHFGIYSQLNRKSKTWFFIFLNVYISWKERNKILVSQLSPPKFRYFADQNGILTIFKCKSDVPKQDSKSRWKNWSHQCCFHIYFLIYGPYIVKNCILFAISCWY